MIFETKINGVTCFCRVDHYRPGRPDKVSGPMEDAEEGYDEEFSYTILDHNKAVDTSLMSQLTADDHDRLLEEYYVTVLEQKHCYGE